MDRAAEVSLKFPRCCLKSELPGLVNVYIAIENQHAINR